jgi:DNA-binding NtrC family response regulator
MLNILLVDDEPDLRLSLGQVLREEGHDVDIAPDGEAAIARMAARPFHLVVSDVKLPKLDGLTLLRRIRKEFPATEVLMMTAYGSIDDAVTAMKDNAVDYLTKPFDIDQLVNVVDRIEDRRRLRDEQQQASSEPQPRSLGEAMDEYEKELILRTIRGTGEKRQKAANLLGISRKSLWKKLTKYGLQSRRDVPDEPGSA